MCNGHISSTLVSLDIVSHHCPACGEETWDTLGLGHVIATVLSSVLSVGTAFVRLEHDAFNKNVKTGGNVFCLL